jgi:epoxyqueuosine reductase
LGNTLDRAAIPALADSLRGDPHPMVRGHAAWALGRIGGNEARAHLAASIREEPDETVREEAAKALQSSEL